MKRARSILQSKRHFEREIIVNLLRSKLAASVCTIAVLTLVATAQELGGDKVDLGALTQIKSEAFQHSQVMENLFYISEVYGPRVTNSRNHRAAAEWAHLAAGTTAIREGSRLERAFRDIYTGTQHAFISEKVAMDVAQIWLGIIDDQFGL